jgi:hypothetical protein
VGFNAFSTPAMTAPRRPLGYNVGMPSNPEPASFIVRVISDDKGERSGVVERVRTGVKERFRGVAAIGIVIGQMLDREEAARAGRTGQGENPS